MTLLQKTLLFFFILAITVIMVLDLYIGLWLVFVIILFYFIFLYWEKNIEKKWKLITQSILGIFWLLIFFGLIWWWINLYEEYKFWIKYDNEKEQANFEQEMVQKNTKHINQILINLEKNEMFWRDMKYELFNNYFYSFDSMWNFKELKEKISGLNQMILSWWYCELEKAREDWKMKYSDYSKSSKEFTALLWFAKLMNLTLQMNELFMLFEEWDIFDDKLMYIDSDSVQKKYIVLGLELERVLSNIDSNIIPKKYRRALWGYFWNYDNNDLKIIYPQEWFKWKIFCK